MPTVFRRILARSLPGGAIGFTRTGNPPFVAHKFLAFEIPMSENRRKNFRCAPPGEGEIVVLRHDGRKLAARMVNISAEGFRICLVAPAGEDAGVTVGDVALLETASGSHQVRVANIQRDEKTLELGLQRMADVGKVTLGARGDNSRGRTFSGRHLGSLAGSPLLQLGAVVAVVALIVAAVNFSLMANGKPGGKAERSRTVSKRDTAATPWQPGPTSSSDGSPGDRQRESNPQPAQDRAVGTTNNTTATKPADANATRGDSVPAGQNTVRSASDGFSPSDGEALVAPRSEASVKITAALKRAGRENKRVLVEFVDDKCDSCDRLHDVLMKDARISAHFQKSFVLVRVDMKANPSVFARYAKSDEGHQKPFLALLNQDGKIVRSRPADEIAGGGKFDIGKVRDFLQPPSASR